MVSVGGFGIPAEKIAHGGGHLVAGDFVFAAVGEVAEFYNTLGEFVAAENEGEFRAGFDRGFELFSERCSF